MIKKILAIILALIMVFSLVSCSKAKDVGETGVITPLPKDGKMEITILVSSVDYNTLFKTPYLADYITKFERDFGININFQEIETSDNAILTLEDNNEYLEKLSTKLIAKDGPDLIFAQTLSLKPLINQGAVVDLRGKVANLDKIYDDLISDKVYYVPLGMMYFAQRINRNALKKLNADEPGLNWTSEDYYALRDKWISANKITFNGYEYSRNFQKFIDYDSIYKPGDNKVVINTPQMRQSINDFRNYIFGGRYQLPEDYKYENYYNMLFEGNSHESKDGFAIYQKNMSNGHIDAGLTLNLFRAKTLHDDLKKYAVLLYSQFKNKEVTIDSFGFLVNKNGKNLDIAYEFINGLLSDEVQLSLFESERDYYPVNKEIEAEILKRELEEGLDSKAIQLKTYALQRLKNGKIGLWITSDYRIEKLMSMIQKDMAKTIFADNPYSDEQLQVELKKLEDKYNIWLNE